MDNTEKLRVLEDLVIRTKGELIVKEGRIEELEYELAQIYKDPLGTLLSIYYSREDLRRAFPEVSEGDYSRLLDWAREQAVSGEDSAHQLLASNAPWYEANPWHSLSKLSEELNGAKMELRLKDNHITNLENTIQQDRNHITNLENTIQQDRNHITNLENTIQQDRNHITNLENRIASMESSLGWKLLLRYRRFNDKWFPVGTRRRRAIEKAFRT